MRLLIFLILKKLKPKSWFLVSVDSTSIYSFVEDTFGFSFLYKFVQAIVESNWLYINN